MSKPTCGLSSLGSGFVSHGVAIAAGLSDANAASWTTGLLVGSSSILRRFEGEANWSGVVWSDVWFGFCVYVHIKFLLVHVAHGLEPLHF